jgi:two-component system, LytTR family, response regulator
MNSAQAGKNESRSFSRGTWQETPAQAHVQSVPIRVLLIEPDTVSRRLICSLLECESDVTVECIDDSRLVSSIHEFPPDLVILDAHTPAIRRAESWGALGLKSPPATIVTAYHPAPLSAFASVATGILVKPFDAERFQTALDIAKSRIIRSRSEVGTDEFPRDPEHRAMRRQFLQRLAVEVGEKIILVRVEDILWLQSSRNHIRLHVGRTSHLIRQSIKNLQAMLDPNRFLRVHRNAIVNLDHVEEFDLPPNGNMFVKLNNGVSLPLRRGNRAMLRKQLKKISQLSPRFE